MLIDKLLRLPKVIRGKDFYCQKDIEYSKLSFGNTGAVWTIHPDILNSKSIIYSFGVGNDISFDLAIIKKFNFIVHAFDPTPKSINWVKSLNLPSNFIFHETGLASYNGTANFAFPENPDHVSASLLNKKSSSGYFQVEVKRVKTIMTELSHDHIDLLKMDIEGAEYEVINDIIVTGIPIKQLLIEFHHRFPEVGISKSKKAIQMIRNAGYVIFHVSSTGEEFSFIKE